jgi:alkylhydroperoxidase/carboxymuconolactone decarboxylase family protein YurZ
MDVKQILDWLASLGLTPLEVLTVIAVIVLYRDNRMLMDRVKTLEETMIDKVRGGPW